MLILAWLLIKWLGGPSEGKISSPSNSQATNSDQSPKPEYTRLDGKYISFAYSKAYRLEKGDTSAVILEAYRLITTAKGIGFSRTIALTVFDLPESKLANNSGYKIRKDNPALYKETVSQINGNKVIFFTKTDEPATVAFCQRGNRLATIGFSGSTQSPGAQSEYDYVINSLEWL